MHIGVSMSKNRIKQEEMKKVVLITGAAGFIGFHLWQLLSENYQLILVDNLAAFSNLNIKKNRLQYLGITTKDLKENIAYPIGNHTFYLTDITDSIFLEKIVLKHDVKFVINLAAATGVRQSISQPELYTKSNILGFNSLLDVCNKNNIKNIIYASSSSVYGSDTPAPFKESAECNHPLSYYAVTKKNNEITADSYASNFNMNLIGLRFFTVYGPWSRPDMANYKFMNAIFTKETIHLYNNGLFQRDFTYVSDIVTSISLLLKKMELGKHYKNEIFNIGNSEPVLVKDYLNTIEQEMDMEAKAIHVKADKEEMDITFSDSSKLFNEINYRPKVSIMGGVKKSVEWYLKYKSNI